MGEILEVNATAESTEEPKESINIETSDSSVDNSNENFESVDNSSHVINDSSNYQSTDNSSFETSKENESNIMININLSYMKAVRPELTDEQIKQIASAKFVGPDRIFHYAFLWGDENSSDLTREFFTKDTDLWDNILGKSARPLTWDHAQDPTFKSNPIIGKTVDWGDDELGRWTLSVLDNAHMYYRAISELIDNGIIGTSSDSAPQYVEREKRGKSAWLKTWPWFASALTATPCEPRMIGTVDFFKNLGVILPDPEALDLQVRAAKIKSKKLFQFNDIFGDLR